MSNIVTALKKGNVTLTNKVIELEEKVKKLQMENAQLITENIKLRDEIHYIKSSKKEEVNPFLNSFTAGVLNQLVYNINTDKKI